MSELVTFREGCPILVARPKSEPPALSGDDRTPQQIAFYDSLDSEFRRKFASMMMPRGRAQAGCADSGSRRYGEFLARLYDVWREYTGVEIEEWT